MKKDKTNKYESKTEPNAGPELRSTSWMDALADGLRAEATLLVNLGLKTDSAEHRTAGLVLEGIRKAIERTKESASIVPGKLRGDGK